MTKKTNPLKKLPDNIKTIAAIITALGTIGATIAGILAFAQNLITSEISDHLDQVETQIGEIRQDTVRLQLLELINGDPENIEGILTVAETYFNDLGGDWYMTGKFKAWAQKHGIDIHDFNFAH